MHIGSLYSDWTHWCIGRPATQTDTRSHTGSTGGSQTRTVGRGWNGTFCRATRTQVQPGDPNWQVTTTLAYDGFGNVNSETVTGIGMSGRTTTASWGGTGQFPVSVTNALGQATINGWNYALGVQTSETDPNGLTTSWTHDNFGRKVTETHPDGTSTLWALGSCWAPSYCGVPSLRGYFHIYHRNASQGTIREESKYFDQFDRITHEYAQGLGGVWTYRYRNLDALGRVSVELLPYHLPQVAYPYHAYSYDLLGRVLTKTLHNGVGGSTTQTTSYQGLRTVGTDEFGKTKTTFHNALWQVVRSQDHDGYFQQFSLDAFGQVVAVTDAANVTLQTASYNVRGLRYASSDADLGSWSYAYNALGELTSHTDAKGQTTSYGYDVLGRMTSRTEPNAGGSITSSWVWGSSAAAKNIGRLVQSSISGAGIAAYSEANSFDALGRLSQANYVEGGHTHAVNYTYNSSTGLLDSIEYPVSTSGYRHKVVYEYSAGVLWKVRDFGNTVTYWRADSADPRGNVTTETLGNGLVTTRGIDPATGLPSYIRTGPGGGPSVQNLNYAWNAVGSLTARQDANQSLTETFTYDNLHRLDYSQLNGSTNLDLSYQANANISWRSDVGSYTYHGTEIHAVTAAGGLSFSYDANGNLTTRSGASVTWYASNQPKTIANASYTSTFEYGPNRNYWKQTATYSNGTETTRYIGGLLEIVQGPSVTSWRHQIVAGGRTVAIYSRGSNGSSHTIYPLRDHLGSTEAITNASGAIIVKTSFAAHGARRGSSWTGSPSGAEMSAIGDATRRGYTDHTMLDNLGLVRMNGRVFDPAIGRFMSADPFIDCFMDTQGWNRYSYVKNNPLSRIDPTGYWGEDFGPWTRRRRQPEQEVVIRGQRVPVGNSQTSVLVGGSTIANVEAIRSVARQIDPDATAESDEESEPSDEVVVHADRPPKRPPRTDGRGYPEPGSLPSDCTVTGCQRDYDRGVTQCLVTGPMNIIGCMPAWREWIANCLHQCGK